MGTSLMELITGGAPLIDSSTRTIILLLSLVQLITSERLIQPGNSPQINDLIDSSTLKEFHNDNNTQHSSNLDSISLQGIFTETFIENIGKIIQDISNISSMIKPRSKYRSKRDNFVHPNSDSKFSKIEDEIFRLRQDIQTLSRSSSLNSFEKATLSTLENSVSSFQSLMDNLNKDTAQKFGKIDNTLESFYQSLNVFRKQLEEIKFQADKKEKIEAEKKLPDECVREILSHRFNSANDILKKTDKSEINYIVKKAYDHQAGNFDLLVKFGIAVSIIEKSFLVLKALHYELESNGHEDAMKLLKLSDLLKSEVINQSKVTDEEKSQAELLFDEIRKSMKEKAIEQISSAFLSDQISTVARFGSDLTHSCYECFNNIMEKVIENVLVRLGTNNLLVLVRKPNGFCCIDQLISIYTAVFNYIKRNGEINSDSSIKLAFHIKELMEMKNYNNVERDKRSQIETVKTNLPKSVKNIVFKSKVCIRNVAYNEYLYAANSDYWYDDERRHVFTLLGGNRHDSDKPGKFSWKLEPDGDEFTIINTAYNEHLYAGYPKWDDDRRYALTWMKGGAVTQGSWIFIPNGDNVYIQNSHHKEYLFADYDRINEQIYRNVFTYVPGSKTGDSVWEIEECL